MASSTDSPATEIVAGKQPSVVDKLQHWYHSHGGYRALQRTFFCVGPVCLKSGLGLGIGFGCGAGIGTGFFPFVIGPNSGGSSASVGGGAFPGFSMPYSAIGQIPGGYMLVDVIKQVIRKFPGSKTGAGCGFGAGYGVGIGLHYGRGGSQGGGFGAGYGGGFGQQQQQGPYGSSFTGGMQPHQPLQQQQQHGVAPPAPSYSSPVHTSSGSTDVNAKIRDLERRMDAMDERLSLQNRVFELEKKIMHLEKKR